MKVGSDGMEMDGTAASAEGARVAGGGEVRGGSEPGADEAAGMAGAVDGGGNEGPTGAGEEGAARVLGSAGVGVPPHAARPSASPQAVSRATTVARRRRTTRSWQDVPVSAIPVDFPVGRTARRLGWVHLPPTVRTAVERRLGAKVVDSISCDAGYTPGMASVLTCSDGSRHFVKAASTKAQRLAADAYRIEARKLRTLPPGVPAPRLQWAHEADDWVVLGIEYVEGRAPARPWTPEDLSSCSDMLVAAAEALTPPPGIGVPTYVEELGSWADLWHSRLSHLPYAAECAALAGRIAEVTAGETLVHCDVRDDNLLLGAAGDVWLCDWNWPVRGAAWLDSLILLVGPRGDGLDVAAHIAAHPLLSAVDPEHIDVVLAHLLGYFSASAGLPRVSNSPYLRTVAAWQRDVLFRWLAERRGWAI